MHSRKTLRGPFYLWSVKISKRSIKSSWNHGSNWFKLWKTYLSKRSFAPSCVHSFSVKRCKDEDYLQNISLISMTTVVRRNGLYAIHWMTKRRYILKFYQIKMTNLKRPSVYCTVLNKTIMYNSKILNDHLRRESF